MKNKTKSHLPLPLSVSPAQVERVERVINAGVDFTVCRLFTLGRQTLLTVG